MTKAGYQAATGAQVALAATTAKTVLGVKAGAAFGVDLNTILAAFDGIVAGNEGVLIELCYATWATNAPGTNSTSVTPAQGYGIRIAHGVTAARAWTAEPTALTVLEEWRVHPQAGVIYPLPLGQTYDCAVSEGFALRMTADDAVNARSTFKWERL